MKTVLIISLIVTLIVDLAMLAYGITRQDRSRAFGYSLVIASVFMYTLGYLLEIMSVSTESAMTALKVENIGIPMASPAFLLCCIGLYHEKLFRKWMPVAVLVYGSLMSMCVMFNEYHHLYYTVVEMRIVNGEAFAVLGRGPMYVAQQVVSIAVWLATFGMLFGRYVRGNAVFRRQMHFIILGSLLPFFANIANFSGILPTGLDLTPFSMTVGLFIFSADVSRYKMMDLAAYAASNAVETMDDAFIALDPGWGFMFCNHSAVNLFPELKEYVGRERIDKEAWWPKELSPEGGVRENTFSRIGEKNNNIFTYFANISKITGLAGRPLGWSIVIRDITDMTMLLGKLEELATIDPLTGIFNRRSFTERVNREMAKAERQNNPSLFVMYDLDHFKDVNDEYGHQAGDYVLCTVSETVAKQLRPYDIFARYGGEEFMIFTTIESDVGDGKSLVELPERLRRAIEKADIQFEGHHIPVTASFGAVIVPSGMKFDEALRAVDKAMYRAKTGGRNRIVYENILSGSRVMSEADGSVQSGLNHFQE